MTALPGTTYPPAPWRLRGRWLLAPVLARQPGSLGVPASRRVRLLPLPAVLALGAYGEGSTLVYREAILARPAVAGGRLGAFIGRIAVDDERSQAGGIAVWDLPKVLARFAFAGLEGSITGPGLEAGLRLSPTPLRLRVRVSFSAIASFRREPSRLPVSFGGSARLAWLRGLRSGQLRGLGPLGLVLEGEAVVLPSVAISLPPSGSQATLHGAGRH